LPSSAGWLTHAHDPQHTGLSGTASVPLDAIRWTTPVDLNPQYGGGGDLFAHYGSPLITPADTVIVPVKTGATNGFRVEGHAAADGTLQWILPTDYALPPHNWVPSFGPTLTPSGRLYFPGAGGTVYFTDTPDSFGTTVDGQLAFYGIGNYNSGLNSTVFINTPITADAAGNIYFGFQVTGANNLNLPSGIARIGADGAGTWIAASLAAGDPAIAKVVDNCAPAVSADGTVLYVAVHTGSGGRGYLLALNAATLAPLNRAALKDPKTGLDSRLSDDGTASPTVGPDGDVYYGVLENPSLSNNARGWLLHFNGALTQAKLPSAFGWDTTPSIVPRALIPSYAGPSSYLVATKYNNYFGVGGGYHRLAVLDPNAAETDPVTGATVMSEVRTVTTSTPGVEWCINTLAVDPFTRSILANNEDGKLYRWDLPTNSLTQVLTLHSPLGEAYTPTLIGPNGAVYAVFNATLYAVQSSATFTTLTSSLATAGAGQPVTFTATVAAAMQDVGAPPGDVTFYDRGVALGVGSLVNGVATLTTSYLAPGNHSVIAVYDGSYPLKPSVSNTISQVVRAGVGLFAVGGAPGRVQVRRVTDGSLVADFAPYGPGYTGPVSVALGDVNDDGYQDLVTGAKAGNPDVRVYDGKDLASGGFDPATSLLAHWFPYALNFNVGANVALGDVNNDGDADVITGASAGNPDVRVYNGRDIAQGTFNPAASLAVQFFAYGLNFNVGANVGAGDVNGDGFADLVTGATLGNPDVRVYSGHDVVAGTFHPNGGSLLAAWFAYGLSFNVGANVAVGDVDGDGFADVVTGASAGNPHVRVISGRDIATKSLSPSNLSGSVLDEFFAYGLQFNVGAAVAAADFDGDGKADILTGASAGSPHYRAVPGDATGVLPPALNGIDALALDLTGGISVAA
jgi:hypothetical protein